MIGLSHCREHDDEATRGTALMGSGNRTYGEARLGEGEGSFLTLADALRLASHPQFSGSVKGLRLDEGPAFEDLSAAVATGADSSWCVAASAARPRRVIGPFFISG